LKKMEEEVCMILHYHLNEVRIVVVMGVGIG
jgi:hypothetical protein